MIRRRGSGVARDGVGEAQRAIQAGGDEGISDPLVENDPVAAVRSYGEPERGGLHGRPVDAAGERQHDVVEVEGNGHLLSGGQTKVLHRVGSYCLTGSGQYASGREGVRDISRQGEHRRVTSLGGICEDRMR